MRFLYNYFKITVIFIIITLLSYYIFEVNSNELLFGGIIHSILAGILTVKLLNTLMLLNNKQKYSIVTFFLLMHVVYFGASSLKYFEAQLLPQMVTDVKMRILGDVLTFSSIYISIIIWYKKINKSKMEFKGCFIKRIKNITVLFWSTFILNIIMSSYQCFLFITYGSYNSTYIILTQGLIFLDSILILFAILNYNKRGKKINIALLILLFVLRGLIYGSRTSLLSPILMIMAGLYITGKISSRIIEKITQYGSVFVIGFSFIFLIINRISAGGIERLKFLLAYRFDLSDFAISILNSGANLYDFNPIKDALLINIPSFLFSNKLNVISYDVSYKLLIEKYGMISGIDYADTYFSMGAMTLGWIGFICIVPIITYIFCTIEINLTNNSYLGIINRFFVLSIVIIIENEWIKFFTNIRNLIILFLISFIIKFLVFKLKVKRYRSG